jgi:hypothetical protein
MQKIEKQCFRSAMSNSSIFLTIVASGERVGQRCFAYYESGEIACYINTKLFSTVTATDVKISTLTNLDRGVVSENVQK